MREARDEAARAALALDAAKCEYKERLEDERRKREQEEREYKVRLAEEERKREAAERAMEELRALAKILAHNASRGRSPTRWALSPYPRDSLSPPPGTRSPTLDLYSRSPSPLYRRSPSGSPRPLRFQSPPRSPRPPARSTSPPRTKKFYKGGQFIPGGGRAPKGGGYF
mmetsp:Transcript_25384/g.85586  ORF Transcript_25384/g.85586 Transcript_25384/m.85586 type:complete len:169 (+) Transcript_25384:771-1277(+)